MKRFHPFASLAGALLVGSALGFAGGTVIAQQSDSSSAQSESDSSQPDAQAERSDQAEDQQTQDQNERSRESQRRNAERLDAGRRDAARQRGPREARDSEGDNTREARRNEASNRFDEDPRERDSSYSRYPSDPTGRAEDRRSESQGAWLGVFLAENSQQNGAFVRSVYPAGPAARAGFRAGDVIVSVDGQQVRDAEGLMQRIEQLEPRQQTQFVVLRNGQQVTLQTRLGDRQTVMFQNDDRRRGEYQREESSDRDSGRSSGDDDFANVPPYAMELEHHRRMAEQHQRLEDMISKLHEEVRQLREELRTSRQ